MKVLYDSSEVRHEIRRIFATKTGRRIAVVGFVGDGADAYLIRPRGTQIYCWPKPGGTNPSVLRQLHREGATIYFVDRLHAKVFWSEKSGCVLGSANLSTNALGAGGLHETGVFVSANSVDIDRLLRSFKSKKMSAKSLSALDHAHTRYLAAQQSDYRFSEQIESFEDWHASSLRRKWKLAFWSDYIAISRKLREELVTDYGTSRCRWIQVIEKRKFRAGDWVLSVRERDGELPSIKWMCIDHIAVIPKSNRPRSAEADAVQRFALRIYGSPPFRIDAEFRRAFRCAMRGISVRRLEGHKSATPSSSLLRTIVNEYRT